MNPKFGKKTKTDFIVTKKTNTILYGSEDDVIIQISYKDLKRFMAKVEKRRKQFGKKTHFNHLSPDVSFFMVDK